MRGIRIWAETWILNMDEVGEKAEGVVGMTSKGNNHATPTVSSPSHTCHLAHMACTPALMHGTPSWMHGTPSCMHGMPSSHVCTHTCMPPTHTCAFAYGTQPHYCMHTCVITPMPTHQHLQGGWENEGGVVCQSGPVCSLFFFPFLAFCSVLFSVIVVYVKL